MKKNIWDNVYYRLKDPVEIRLAVLYTIKYVGFPISDIEVKHFMLSATTVDFIELCEIIGSMEKENYIKTEWRDEQDKYTLTLPGSEMIDMFEDKIMPSVRENLRNTIDEYYKRKSEEAKVRAGVSPVSHNTWQVDVQLNEGKSTLLTMSIYAGDKQKAFKMKNAFKNNSLEVYTKISQLLNSYENEEE